MQQGKKVVIADDDKGICELITEFLTDQGYKVDAVYNGYELLAYLKNTVPAVIILDLMMPEKDGTTILNTLKQVSPNSRIIIYTGHREYENSVYARAADRFLIKSDSIEELARAVAEFL